MHPASAHLKHWPELLGYREYGGAHVRHRLELAGEQVSHCSSQWAQLPSGKGSPHWQEVQFMEELPHVTHSESQAIQFISSSTYEPGAQEVQAVAFSHARQLCGHGEQADPYFANVVDGQLTHIVFCLASSKILSLSLGPFHLLAVNADRNLVRCLHWLWFLSGRASSPDMMGRQS